RLASSFQSPRRAPLLESSGALSHRALAQIRASDARSAWHDVEDASSVPLYQMGQPRGQAGLRRRARWCRSREETGHQPSSSQPATQPYETLRSNREKNQREQGFVKISLPPWNLQKTWVAHTISSARPVPPDRTS